MQTTVKNIMLFIAELNNFKNGTPEAKLAYGTACYINNKLHHLDELVESDRKEMHVNIWLERLYADLDQAYSIDSDNMSRTLAVQVGTVPVDYKWSVPIELDASASMLQYMGALLGDARLLEMTNCTTDLGLTDPWGTVDGVPRSALKKVFTPRLYGSMQDARTLLEREDVSKEDIVNYVPLIRKEEKLGAFGAANCFKDFIIKHCQPSEDMTVTIGSEDFNIKCNRYKSLGDHQEWFKFLDSASGKEKVVPHYVTKQVPDLVAFKRYFVTLLVHNLDSQVADAVSEKTYDKYGWIIPIHDAFLVPPQAAEDVRQWYAEEITAIYQARKSILSNYFASIGITGSAQADWEALQAMAVPVSENFVCSPYALK